MYRIDRDIYLSFRRLGEETGEFGHTCCVDLFELFHSMRSFRRLPLFALICDFGASRFAFARVGGRLQWDFFLPESRQMIIECLETERKSIEMISVVHLLRVTYS